MIFFTVISVYLFVREWRRESKWDTIESELDRAGFLMLLNVVLWCTVGVIL